ncbi:glucose 1-dehydrogenase [Paraburkholderia sp. LEh10]|uniref:SDR family NAD(P)-dependent oxidoreductase n=1 Tax=Paraburkholderia sp. LEh10 TaxID=2821353 RepID=UPI001AE4E549|nr:glucose 1-dehydrogenase [Paraburkholderia sp. LEh10]MBP0589406.1 glucose 1-dehydrogenase [Paraburkholderia sp. LEh10]
MAENGRLHDKVAIVTGASRGIGRAISNLFSEHGAQVIMCDRDEPKFASLENQHFRRLNVADAKAWEELALEIAETFDSVHVLINNAGIADYLTITEASNEAWQKVMAVNLDGVLFGMRAIIPHMQAKGRGSIINISSIWGSVSVVGAASYHASKGAVRNLTKNAAITYASDGVRANSIHPGIIATPLVLDGQDPALSAEVVARTPMKRMAQPIEVAYGALFLASDESSFVTGTELYIDGGYTAQ